MGNLAKELAKCKHPNSRKTKALAKKAKRMNNKHRNQFGHAIKSNILGEKLSWFLPHVEDRTTPLTPREFRQLIETYLQRFDEEIEQIKLKQSISKNRANQHVSRLNVIKFTLEREKDEFNGGGLELLNLCDMEKLKSLQQWDGNAINVQHFKLDLISRHFLSKLEKEQKKSDPTLSSVQLTNDAQSANDVEQENVKEKKEEAMLCD
ncbi:unnamed protein product [Hermetia illucens]|uniref:Translation machinery-associated protein 16 homolog n=1 Tax=Hermetia illucens TaxID=343691 RepID=A0A7R8UXQ5_HERIL|nr:translation machinery-associated protein 16 homolog [Hermetia illucens]CAD7089062.1 unnamed protein product [Hermetia illucens]